MASTHRGVLLVAACLAVLAADASRAADGGSLPTPRPPEVRIDRVEDLGDASGITKSFIGWVRGNKFLFKPDEPQLVGLGGFTPIRAIKTGNIEGEILASRILRRVGIVCPRVRRVHVAGRTPVYGMIEYIGNVEGAPVAMLKSLWAERGEALASRVSKGLLRRMMVADLLIGNGDRHTKNILLADAGASKPLVPVAIDHNAAFLTSEIVPNGLGAVRNFIESFWGSTRVYVYKRGRLPDLAWCRAGSVGLIWGDNPLYMWMLRRSRPADFDLAVRAVTDACSDAAFLADLKALGPTLDRRKRDELIRILRWRRTGLKEAIESFYAELVD